LTISSTLHSEGEEEGYAEVNRLSAWELLGEDFETEAVNLGVLKK